MNRTLRIFALPGLLAACSSDLALPEVQISPAAPTTLDDLTAEWSWPGTSDSPDVVIEWFQDETRVQGVAGPVLPAERTSRSERWSVRVRAAGATADAFGSAEVLIQNAAPTVSLSLSPETPTSLDPLVATADVNDPDGDPVDVTWTWTRDGAPTDITADRVPPARTSQGEVWEVTVNATDGVASAAPASASVTIEASGPLIRGMAFTPDPPNGGENTQLDFEALDPDGGDLQVQIAWAINGATVADVTDDRLPFGRFKRNDTVRATVTASNDSGETTTAQLEAIAGNAVPYLEAVLVQPETANVTHTITCSPVGLVDPDGDVPTVSWEWRVNGAAISRFGNTLRPLDEGVVRGDRVQCFAIPADPFDTGPPFPGATLILVNAPPSVASASIIQPTTDGDPLTVSLGEVSDPDDDDVDIRYRWVAGGTVLGTEAELASSAFSRGQTIQLFVTPVDALGLEGPEVEATGSFTAANRPPVVLGHTATPEQPSRDGDLFIEPVTFDPDGDPVSITWTWRQNNVVVPSVTGPSFPADAMVRGRNLTATLVPSDGDLDGPAYVAGPYEVVNAPPRVLSGTFEVGGVETLEPVVNSTTNVRCQQTGLFDADPQDLLTVTVEWIIDDQVVSTNEVLSSSLIERGDVVTCVLTASDQITTSEPFVVGSFEVVNAPPVLGNVRIDPSAPRTTDTLTATALSVTDPDGPDEDITLTYEWRVGTEVRGTGEQLPSTEHRKGDNVVVRITATDADGGSASQETSVQIRNSPPVITNAFLTPTNPRRGQVVTIEGEWSDPDPSDTLTPTVEWRRNGSPIPGQTGLTLDGSANPNLFRKGDTLSATLRFNDGSTNSNLFNVPPVTVADSPPGDPLVQVTPRVSAGQDRDLRCEIAREAIDPDPGDTVTYRMRWFRNGSLYQGGGGLPAPAQTIWPGDTILREVTENGETWECEATALSGTGENALAGGTHTSTARIRNLPFRDLGMGANFGCGRDRGDRVRCWGDSALGQTEVPTFEARRLFVTDAGGCLYDTSGVLRCWGRTPNNPPTQTLIDISLGSTHACGRTATNQIRCWGDNSENQASPIDPDTGNQITGRKVAVGGRHSCALRNSGALVCWGEPLFGQLDVPTDGPYLDLAAGSDWSCALDVDGRVACWGRETRAAVTDAPSGAGFVAITAGAVHACALRADDTAVCWGDDLQVSPLPAPPGETWAQVAPGQTSTCGTTLDGEVLCWGASTRGQLIPGNENLPWLAPGAAGFTASQDTHSCFINEDAGVECWGDNEFGQASPPAFATPMDRVYVGREYSCARVEATKNLSCWGRNDWGIRSVPTGLLYEKVSPGRDHACAISPLGGLVCWGRDDHGETDHPTTGSWIDVSTSERASCAIDNSNQLHCWGDATSPILAQMPTGTAFRRVDVGGNQACAIRDTDRGITCWGTGQAISNPPGTSGLDQIVVGRNHACALNAIGEILCWGDNTNNRLEAPTGRYNHLIDGVESSCASRTEGAAPNEFQRTYCWGHIGRR